MLLHSSLVVPVRDHRENEVRRNSGFHGGGAPQALFLTDMLLASDCAKLRC